MVNSLDHLLLKSQMLLVDETTEVPVNETDSSNATVDQPTADSVSNTTTDPLVNGTEAVNATKTEVKKEMKVKSIKEKLPHEAVFIDLPDDETNENRIIEEEVVRLES